MLGVVKSVESIYFDLNNPETSEAYNLTKGQNTSNCVPFIAYKLITTSDDSRQWRADVYFSGGQLVVERESSTGRILGHINVVEFDPNKVRVQQGSFNIERQGISTVPHSGSFSLSQTVTESRSFPVVHYRPYDYSSGDDDWCRHASRFYFTGGGASLSWIRYQGDGLGLTGHYYIVESLDGTFTCERSYIDLGAPDLYKTDTINSVNLDKTFLISTTYSCACEGTLSRSGPYVRLLNSTTTEADRFTTGNCYRLDMYVIEFHDDTIVYHGDFNFGSGDTIDDITLPSAVDSNFSMAIGPTIWGSKGAGTAYPEMFIWPRVYNTTTVRGERQSSGSTITGRYQVIQFAQAPGYYFAGYVTELGSPVTRTVRAYHRDTGELLGDATSSGVGGYYYLETTYSGSQYIITLDDTSGDTYNLLGYDLMVPTTISG